MYRGRPVPIDVYDMYRKSVRFETGWVHTQSLIDEPLALIANGKFDPSPVTTAVVDWDQCADALVDPFTKLIITRKS